MRTGAHAWMLLGSSLLWMPWVAACGGTQRPAPTPCMSDRECRADRICHDGRCQFLEDVEQARREARATQPEHPVEPPPETPTGPSGVAASSFMGGPQRTGQSPHAGPATEPTVAWRFATTGRIFSSPIIGPEGRIFVGSLDGTFSAVNRDGSLAWRFAGRDRFYATAALGADGTVYVGSDDGGERGHVYAISTTGQLVWHAQLGEPVESSLLVVGENIFVAADGVYAFDSAGTEIWHVAVAGRIRGAPTLHPSGFLLVGTAAGELLAIDTNGRIRWRVQIGGAIEGAAAVASNGVAYLGSSLGHIVAVDSLGVEQWRHETGGRFEPPPPSAVTAR